MTPAEIRSIRHSLGLSTERMARLLGIASGRTVRRWEAGSILVPKPVVILLDLLKESSPEYRASFIEKRLAKYQPIEGQEP